MRIKKELRKQIECSSFFLNHPEKKAFEARRATNKSPDETFFVAAAPIFFCLSSWYCLRHPHEFLYSVPMSLLFVFSVILALLSFCGVLYYKHRRGLDYRQVLKDCENVADILELDRQYLLACDHDRLWQLAKDYLVSRASFYLAIEGVMLNAVRGLQKLSKNQDSENSVEYIQSVTEDMQLQLAQWKSELFIVGHKAFVYYGLANPEPRFYFREAERQPGNIYNEARDPIHTDRPC